MTDAERQARRHAARASGTPAVRPLLHPSATIQLSCQSARGVQKGPLSWRIRNDRAESRRCAGQSRPKPRGGTRTRSRFPITDILRQTPQIPDVCQWAIFLRNHDELTLEMVTDAERDVAYYGQQKRRLAINIPEIAHRQQGAIRAEKSARLG